MAFIEKVAHFFESVKKEDVFKVIEAVKLLFGLVLLVPFKPNKPNG